MKLFNKSKKIRYGAHSFVLTVLFIAAVILVNILTGAITDRFPSINLDLNENKMFSLSSQTETTLEKLSKDVKVIVVTTDSEPRNEHKEFLGRYEELSSKISVEYVNVKKDPASVKEYSDDIDPNGTFLIICGDRHEAIDATVIDGSYGRLTEAESYLTNAIVSVTSDEKKSAWFTTGHGEGAYEGLKKIYKNKYFDVSDVDLKQTSEDMCDMIVIAAPSQDFTQQELAKIDSLAKKGVSLFILLNNQSQYLPNLADYISEWGLEVKNEIVVEQNSSNVYTDFGSFIAEMPESDYTKNINSSYPLIYEPPYRIDVQYSGTKSTEITEILTTTNKAVAGNEEKITESNTTFVVAAVSERIWDDNQRGHLFLSGSPLWLSYPYENISGLPANKQLVNSVISEFTGSEDYVEIESKTTNLKPFMITETQFYFIAAIIVILSLALIAFGIIVWRHRRYL